MVIAAMITAATELFVLNSLTKKGSYLAVDPDSPSSLGSFILVSFLNVIFRFAILPKQLVSLHLKCLLVVIEL